MAQVKKNDFIVKLRERMAECWEVQTLLPRSMRLQVALVDGHTMQEMLKREPQRRGCPTYATFHKDNNQSLSVFPRADKRYRLRVVGTRIIEQ